MEFTHKEQAINFCHDFAEITDDSNITNAAKQSAILAVKTNVINLEGLLKDLTGNKREEVAKVIMSVINDEKKILAELECISV